MSTLPSYVPSLEEIGEERMRRAAARENFERFVMETHHDYQMTKFHKHLCLRLQALANYQSRFIQVVLPPRHGKALAVGTPILTPDGFRPIEDLKPGDFVIGPQGAPTKVIATSPIWKNRPVYRITSADGAELLADAEHEWLVQTCRKAKKWRARTTKSLLPRSGGRKWVIPRQRPVRLNRRPLPVEPWVLGYWLGDGCTRHATITSGDEDIDWVRREFELRGFRTTDRATEGTFGVLALQRKLRELGVLDNKHIPDEYFIGSKDQRLLLLQGLIDSDGHVSPQGLVEFCSTNLQLAEGVQFLIRSLGARARICEGRATLNGKDCGPKYRVMFYLKNCARMPRKRANSRDQEVRTHRYITVEPAGTADTVCIEVAHSDHLFLAGTGLIVTRNSELGARRLPAWTMGRDPNTKQIQTAHTQPLANSFSQDVKRIIRDPEYSALFPGTRIPTPGARNHQRKLDKVSEWEVLTSHGRFRAAGTAVAIVGKGYNRIGVDDPIRNREEAENDARRDKIWAWFHDDLMTRVEYPYTVLISTTRWHRDDLAGRLQREEGTTDEGGKWEVIRYPFLQDSEPRAYDEREIGEPLWPTWFMSPWEFLPGESPPDVTSMPEADQPLEVTMDELVARAIYAYENFKGDRDAVLQGTPVAEGGNIIRHYQHWASLPGGAGEWAVFCDPKGGSKDPRSSRAVIQLWFHPYGDPANIYMIAQAKGLWDQPETLAAFRTLMPNNPWARAGAKWVEPKADGKAIVALLRSEIPGMREFKMPPGEKAVRYRAAAPYWVNVWLPPAEYCIDPLTGENWLNDFVQEHKDAPAGVHDDQIDTSTMAVFHFFITDEDGNVAEESPWADWPGKIGRGS